VPVDKSQVDEPSVGKLCPSLFQPEKSQSFEEEFPPGRSGSHLGQLSPLELGQSRPGRAHGGRSVLTMYYAPSTMGWNYSNSSCITLHGAIEVQTIRAAANPSCRLSCCQS
jgi:hypothetical protein